MLTLITCEAVALFPDESDPCSCYGDPMQLPCTFTSTNVKFTGPHVSVAACTKLGVELLLQKQLVIVQWLAL
jgi:hypothetical protein